MKAHDLTVQIEEGIEKLAASVEAARQSEQFKTYARFAGSFYRYSFGNVWLIMMQNPDAEMVAGYHDWLKKKRFVKKGEHGIAIIAPCVTKPKDGEDANERRLYFKTAYVFDVTQTDGEPLPVAPDWRSTERQEILEERLMALAQMFGVTSIKQNAELGRAQGHAKPRTGEVAIAPGAGTKILVHEIAHVLLKHGQKDGATNIRATAEIQAEGVAYIVAQHFGMDVPECANYLATWTHDAKAIKDELQTITRAASEIIRAVEDAEPKAEVQDG